MATFVNSAIAGYWNGDSINYMYITITGNVSRSGNTVTLSGMSVKYWTRYSSYGSGWFPLKINGNDRGFTWSGSGSTAQYFSPANVSFSVSTTQTSANVSWSGDDGTSGSFSVSFPSGYVAPTVPTVSASATAYNSVSITYGTTSFGVPSSGTVYLYGGTSASPTTQIATKTTTGNSTYTWSSRAGNTKYYIRSRAGNGSGYSEYSSDKTVITPCQTPSSISLSSQTYTAYNKVSATISITRASDGNAATRTLYYRYKTGSGGSWSSWVSAGTMDNSTTTKTATITGLATSSTIYIEAKLNNGLDSASKSFNFSTKTTHTAPNFSNFTYEDTNTAAIHITGSNQVMLQGQSDPKITISTANKATGNDGIAVSNYSFSFSGRSDTATWSSSSAVTKTLGKPTTSGTQTMTVSAVDALSLSKAVNKSVTVYPWSAPTVTATATRLNNFENDTTIHIVGTWSPVTISGVNKNTMEVKYRYKQSTTTTWGSWITLSASHNTANWTTQDFVLNLDNNYSWNLEAYVGDYFTSKTASITIPAGQPQFFIGADGRCAVGGKPTKAKVSGKKGQLETHGQIYIPNASGAKTDCGLVLENSTAGTDTMAWFQRSDTGGALGVGVGSGGINHGLWSEKQNRWIVYGDNQYSHLNGSAYFVKGESYILKQPTGIIRTPNTTGSVASAEFFLPKKINNVNVSISGQTGSSTYGYGIKGVFTTLVRISSFGAVTKVGDYHVRVSLNLDKSMDGYSPIVMCFGDITFTFS